MKRLVAVPLAMVFAALVLSPLHAYFRGGVGTSFGKDDYKSTTVSLEFGTDNLSVNPVYNRYDADSLTKAVQTFSVRAGWDTKLWGAGVTLGSTPKVSNYKNTFLGADAAFSLTPTGGGRPRRMGGAGAISAPRGKGLARVDVGASILHTIHTDDSPTASNAAGSKNIGQTDISGFVGGSFMSVLMSIHGTQSIYSKKPADKARNGFASAGRTKIVGLSPAIVGFPDSTYNVKVEFPMFPMVAPYASYTYMKFKEGPGTNRATAYNLGVAVGLEMLEVRGAWEIYKPKDEYPLGFPFEEASYFTLGVALRF